MFLRHTTVTKRGKSYTYWRLVRSVRVGNQVRQQTVAQLGELDEQGRLRAQALAHALLGDAAGPSWFDEPVPDEPITVLPNGIHLERGRRFGDVFLGWKLWQALELDRLLDHLVPAHGEDVPWGTMAAVLVLARLCQPQSELHIAESWFRQTALEDLLGVPPAKINDDRLYRALDHLLPHKATLEAHIKARLGTLFQLDYDLILYDITSTYFEGQAARNPQAKRGYSRDHRSDCLQVCIGLVVTREGFPLGYEVFAGNRNDATTVKHIITRIEERYGREQRIWVMDRGMINRGILDWLRSGGRSYIVGTPRDELKHCADQLKTGKWEAVRDGLSVQLFASPDGQDQFLLCRSADRALKEEAMRVRFEARIEAGLQRIEAACRSKKYRVGVIERRVGRLLGRNSRAAGLFAITVQANDRGAAVVSWSKKAAALEWAQQCQGCYVLRTNVAARTGMELWHAYMQLTAAEAAFRIQKDQLGLRPIWHQRADRVEAHILVCFLAYVLFKTLEGWSARAGLGQSPAKLLEELGRIESADVVLPTTDGRIVRLRCVVHPDKPQTVLLDHLGLKLPQRLRIPRGVPPM